MKLYCFWMWENMAYGPAQLARGELFATSEPVSTSPRVPEQEGKDACREEAQTILSKPQAAHRGPSSPGPQTTADTVVWEPL